MPFFFGAVSVSSGKLNIIIKNLSVCAGDVCLLDSINLTRAQQFLVFCQEPKVNEASVRALENLRILLNEGISNDLAKFCMPESYKTELSWSINARSLQNFLSLRSARSALWEIQNLARAIFDALPDSHKYLFSHCLQDDTKS